MQMTDSFNFDSSIVFRLELSKISEAVNNKKILSQTILRSPPTWYNVSRQHQGVFGIQVSLSFFEKQNKIEQNKTGGNGRGL